MFWALPPSLRSGWRQVGQDKRALFIFANPIDQQQAQPLGAGARGDFGILGVGFGGIEAGILLGFA